MPRRSRRRRFHEDQEYPWADPLLRELEEMKLGPPPYPKAVWIRDDTVFGFALRIRRSGKQSFVFECRLQGKPKRFTFKGRSPKEARKWARTLALKLDAGLLAPTPPKAASYSEKTLRRAIHEYFAWRKPKSEPEMLACLENHAGSLLNRPIESLGREEICELATVVDRTKGRFAAGAMVKFINTIGNYYAKRTDRFVWPLVPSPLTKKDRRARDRVLADHEIAALWHACDRAGVFGRYVQFLMLTALRRNEAAHLTREEVAEDFSKLTLGADKVKTETPFVLPLSAAAADLLRGMPNEGERFFPFGSVSRCKKLLDAMVKQQVAPWRLHDLRRTSTTLLEADGTPPHIIKAVINHVIHSGVTGTYARHTYLTEKKDALERLATLLATITR